MKQYASAIIFGISIVTSSLFLGKSYVDRNKVDGKVRITGLGKANFSSDLIIWEGSFEAENIDLQKAYISLENKKAKITKCMVRQKGF